MGEYHEGFKFPNSAHPTPEEVKAEFDSFREYLEAAVEEAEAGRPAPNAPREDWGRILEHAMKQTNRIESDAQADLAKKHGTPHEYAIAVYRALGELSIDEAIVAIESYAREWNQAKP